MGRIAAAGAALLGVALLAGQTAGAADVYRWTDEKGVVHFADVPPPQMKQFTTESLPDAPPPAPAEAAANPEAVAAEVTPGSEEKLEGPARVVLTDKDAVPVGPSTQSFRGKVKNSGGAVAHEVSIAIVVTEPVQGAECLREEIDVQPSTLEPGAVGTFVAQFDNPCFHGPTDADLRAEWR